MTEVSQPPCHQIGDQPNACAVARYRRVVENTTPLYGDWTGWRMAGRDLVAPNGVRFRPQRLLAMAWAEKNAAIKARRPTIQTTVCLLQQRSLPARERFEGYA